MQTRGTKFCKFQSAKLQELPDQVPVGHVPRCIDVQIRGSLTRIMLPGNYGSEIKNACLLQRAVVVTNRGWRWQAILLLCPEFSCPHETR